MADPREIAMQEFLLRQPPPGTITPDVYEDKNTSQQTAEFPEALMGLLRQLLQRGQPPAAAPNAAQPANPWDQFERAGE